VGLFFQLRNPQDSAQEPVQGSVPFCGMAAFLDTPMPRPSCGFLAHCTAPIDLWNEYLVMSMRGVLPGDLNSPGVQSAAEGGEKLTGLVWYSRYGIV